LIILFEKIKFHANLTLGNFWLSWFGNFGRELGSNVPHSFGTNPYGDELSHRMFTDKPSEYMNFIDWCIKRGKACWITSQPMREYGVPLGIEKLFFDFDYPLKKNWNMTPRRREKVKEQVLEFLKPLDYEPLLVATRKGFHAYIFLRRVYEFEPQNFDFAKDVFGVLALSMIGLPKLYEQLEEEDRKKWKYLDFVPLGDINRMARVPLTPHEKTGEVCQILDRKLKPTKVRSLDLYRTYGLREDKIREAVEIVKDYYQKKVNREKRRIESGSKDFANGGGKFHGQIRPCFLERMRIGEMVHQQRLAFLIEIYWSKIKNQRQWSRMRKEETMINFFRQFKDFKEKETRYYVNYFLNHNPNKFPPYRCKTLERLGYCLKSECPFYKQ